MSRSLTIIALITMVLAYQLTIAIRPATSPGPVVRSIPSDLFQNSGWIEQTYVSQVDYLNSLYPGISVTLFNDELPTPTTQFTDGFSASRVSVMPGRSPHAVDLEKIESDRNPERLFAQGTRIRCAVSGDERYWCTFQVLVAEKLPDQRSVSLVQVRAGPREIFLVDGALLGD